MSTWLSSDYLRQVYGKKFIDNCARDPGDSDSTVEATITIHLDSAEALVKETLSRLYTAVQVEASANTKRIAAIFAMYSLEGRRTDARSEHVAEDYRMALDSLSNILDGTIILTGSTQLLPTISPNEHIKAFEQTDFFLGYVDEDDI
jgi:phage gp36-like protein